MSVVTPEFEKNDKRFLRWLLITYLMLVCMAFFSALGGFFIRIFFVLSLVAAWRAYTLYTFRTKIESDERSAKSYSSRRDQKYSEPRRDPSADSKESMINQIKAWPIHLKIVRAIWAFIILVSLLVFFVVAFSSGNIDTQFYLQSAKDYYDMDQYDSAYVNFKRVLRADDENTEALFGYGNTLFTRGYPDSSIYYYDKVLSLDPGFDEAQYNKAWVFLQRQMYNEAIQELNSLIESNTSYYAAYQLLGDCYYTLSQYDDALTNYEVAYNNEWKSQWLCYTIGYLYQTRNDTDKAISLYEESLQYDENNVEVLKQLSELLPGENGNGYRQRLTDLSK